MPSRGEFSFIDQLQRRARAHSARQAKGLVVGIGDDAAVWRHAAAQDSVVSADLLVETIDFRLDWRMTAADLGHKALAVSLSDIAAMGARPRWALVSVGVTAKLWRGNFLDRFYEGFFALAAEHGVTLIGGDVSRTPERVAINSVVIGEVRRGRAVLRSGAAPGDLVFVTGCLGGAAAGLQFLAKQKRRKLADPSEALRLRQLRPAPRVGWGQFLGERRFASAMIDLSDGFSSDLHHLCRASDVGARIELAALPVDSSLAAAGFTAHEALRCALHGGEDFELLFTVPRRKAARLPTTLDGVPVTRVGEITRRQDAVNIYVNGRWRRLTPSGFTHF